MQGWVAIFLALAGLLLLLPSSARAEAGVVRQQDGIIARLEVTPNDAKFSWRFTRRPPSQLDRVEASVDGHAVRAASTYEPFGRLGETAAVTFLIDTGGLERAQDIEAGTEEIFATVAALPSAIHSRIATYDLDYHVIERPTSVAAFRSAARPHDVASDLSLGLQGALDGVGREEAARRAIYVYTDGYNVNARTLASSKALAVSRDVSVTFVLKPSIRLVDLASIEDLAKATGGRLITRPGDVGSDIATYLMSGASIRYALDQVRRFFWQSPPVLSVVLWYGDRKLVADCTYEAPTAGLGETFTYAWQRGWLLPGGLAAIGLSGLLPLWAWRRRKRAPSPSVRSML